MADYVVDDNGIVHVINETSPGGEFTFCDREFGCGGGGGEDGEFHGSIVRGPSNCKECRKVVDKFRMSIKGVRWSSDKAQGDDT